MKSIGRFEFPETREEALAWKEVSTYTVLHRNVMMFAHTRIEGAWTAYCYPVPGMRHADEVGLWRTEENACRQMLR